jgi:hypothetical protein
MTERSEYTVGIVVDLSYGGRLQALVGTMPMWIIDSPVNRAAAESHWRTHPGETHTSGITTFRVDPKLTPEEWCAEVLDVVLGHHGTYSHNPPVTVLEVIGARPVADLVALLADHGFVSVKSTGEGFQARAA